MRGFLAVDKPQGWSSHKVVSAVRRATGIKKVGHAGTLDPMATGLLVVAIGPVTRLISYVQDAEKEYIATARFGIATDSLDADGEVVDEAPMPVTREDVEGVVAGFVGEIQQVPPMVSALKRDGKRLYQLAREGVEVEREPRTVTIHELEVIGFEAGNHPDVSFRVVCSKGTYVRTLGDDLARALGGFAHLTALRRTRIGSTPVEGALDPEHLTLEAVQANLKDPADAVSMLPSITVDETTALLVANGRSLSVDGAVEVDVDADVVLLDSEQRLLAVYRVSGNRLLPKIVLPQ